MKSLVLLHGWGATEAIWGRQVEAFERMVEVWTPRLPEWDAGWLTTFLADLDLPQSILVGWSLGGMLLLETLAGLRSLTPAAVVLVGVAPVFCQRPDHPWGQPEAAVRAMRRALRRDAAQVVADFAAACLAPGEEAFRQEAAAGFEAAADPGHLAQGLDYLREKDLRGLLPRTPGPVIIIQGEQDGIVDPSQAEFLKEHLPGANLHVMAGAGHLPFLTQAEAFKSILMELFR
jgi:pimeloyl-[acyl-carrier protein] methyl ester esterase